jgi:hypothetical protein
VVGGTAGVARALLPATVRGGQPAGVRHHTRALSLGPFTFAASGRDVGRRTRPNERRRIPGINTPTVARQYLAAYP